MVPKSFHGIVLNNLIIHFNGIIVHNSNLGLGKHQLLLTVSELARYHATSRHYLKTRPERDLLTFMKVTSQFQSRAAQRIKGQPEATAMLRKLESACIKAVGEVYRYNYGHGSLINPVINV